MKHWDGNDYHEFPAVDAFLQEIIEVCRKHGMSIGHEDSQGAFKVYLWFDGDDQSLMNAHVIREEQGWL